MPYTIDFIVEFALLQNGLLYLRNIKNFCPGIRLSGCELLWAGSGQQFTRDDLRISHGRSGVTRLLGLIPKRGARLRIWSVMKLWDKCP